jgi:photosystem II stability/assembly factor-like uncharacterized protein
MASAIFCAGATVGLPAVAEVTDPTTVLQPAEIMPLASQSQLLDITVAGTRVVAVGDRGHVLTSDDKGETWTQQNVPARQMLISVDFADSQNGWAVGHDSIILRTRDGGESWETQNFDAETGQPLYGVLALSDSDAWAVGSFGKFFRTTDGGETWEAQEVGITEPGVHLISITQLPSGTLVVVGEAGMVAYSTDNGDNWNLGQTAYAGSYFGVLPMGNNGVMLYGLRGTARSAADVGALPEMDPWDLDAFSIQSEWTDEELAAIGYQNVAVPAATAVFGGAITYDGNYVMVGQNGSLYKGTPGKTELTSVPSPTNKSLNSVVALDDRLIAVGLAGVQVIKLQ